MGDALDTPAGRLKSARTEAGYRSAAKFAADAGVDDATYRSHEMRPGAASARAFNEEAAQLYADRLGVNWMWLLYGDSVAPRRGAAEPTRIAGVSEAQAAATLRPILAALDIDAGAARLLARAFLRAIRAAQALDAVPLKESHFEIAGALAAQEAAREWQHAD